jgi:hypothetical protein
MNDERPNSSRGRTPLLLVGVAVAGLAGARRLRLADASSL